MSHRCPAPKCETQVPSNQYACRAHWYSLPKPLRDEIWAAYREEPLGKAHTDAMLAADEFLRAAPLGRPLA